MSFAAAAALLINYGTGWFALPDRATILEGEWLLVPHGRGRCRLRRDPARPHGPRCTRRSRPRAATTRSRCAARSAPPLAVDYRADDFVPRVKEHTDGHGADVVYDPVGGDVFDGSRRCIAWGGRILVIGFASGRVPDVPPTTCS